MKAKVSASVATAVAVGVCALLVGAVGRSTAEVARAGVDAAVPTRAQLAAIALPRDAFGPEANGLEVDIGSGVTDNADLADATLDPKDTPAQIARAGWIAGYDLSYSDLSGAALIRGSGLLYVDSSLDLFKTPRAADAFLTKQARDAERLRGKRVELGARLLASSTFPTGEIGAHTIGLRTTVAIGKVRFTDTLVGFRIGSLIAAVGIERADAKSASGLSIRLARKLAARVKLGAAGKLGEYVVRVPPIGRKGVRPAGQPDLAAMALTTGNLGKGTALARQGYVDDDTTIGSYEREFDLSSTRSRAATFVESDISLFRHADEATGFLLGLRMIYAAPQIEQDLAEDWREPTLRVEQRPSLAVGDGSTAIVLRAPGADRNPVRVVIVHIRVGRVLGTLTVGGPVSSLRVAEANQLAATLARRIRLQL